MLVLCACLLQACVARKTDANDEAAAGQPVSGTAAPKPEPELEWPPSFGFLDESKLPAGLRELPSLKKKAQAPEKPPDLETAFNLIWDQDDPEHLHYNIWHPPGNDGAGFVDLLHAKWVAVGEDWKLRRRASRVLYAFLVRASNNSLRRESRGEDSPSTLDISKLLQLLEDTYQLGGEYLEALLSAFARTWALRESAETREFLLKKLASVQPDRRHAWGLALVNFRECPTEYRDDMCRCYHAAYDRLLQNEQEGRLDIKLSPAFGEGAYSETAKSRGDIIWAAHSNICREAANLFAHSLDVELEHRPDVLTGARLGIELLDVAWPETPELLRRALDRDDADFNLAALELMRRNAYCPEELLPSVQNLAQHIREDVRANARELLQDAGATVPEYREFELDRSTADRLIALSPLRLADARRVTARARRNSAWGGWGMTENRLPGWLIPSGDEWLFVSDELDYTFGSLSELDVQETSFAEEIREVAEREEPEDKDESTPSPGFGSWVIGHRIHDALRLIYAVEWERRNGTVGYPLSTKLYVSLMRHFVSLKDFEARVAYDLTWQCLNQCVSAFGVRDDRCALIHADVIRRYQPWARPRTDSNWWIHQAGLIERDVRIREAGYLTQDKTSLDYWLERLPEVRIAQIMQPGGAGIAEDRMEVAARIYMFGLDAVWPLFDRLDDNDRLVRGCGFWRDFARNRSLYTTGAIARWILDAIILEHLGVSVEYDYYLPENRHALRAWLGEAIELLRK